MSIPRIGRYGPCESIKNVLVDAFLPMVGSWPLSDNGGVHYAFEEQEGGAYTALGWARDSDNELIGTLPYNYGPFLPLSMSEIVHSIATTHGDPRKPSRYLKVEVTVEMSPYMSSSGPDPWYTVDSEGTQLPDYGGTDNRVYTFIWLWDEEQDPDGYVSFEASLAGLGQFWTRNKQENGEWADTRTLAGDALWWEAWGGHCNPNNWTYALQVGGTAAATYMSLGDNAELTVEFSIPEGYSGTGSYYFNIVIEKSMMYSPAPGPTDDPPTWESCHDQVAAILNTIDLSSPGKVYTFYESAAGVGTAKSVTLLPRNQYYIVPFWKRNPDTGNNTTERLLDIIRVPNKTRFTCTANEEGPIYEGGEDTWCPAGDGYVDSIGLDVTGWQESRLSLLWLGVGWFGYNGTSGEWPEGFSVPAGTTMRDGWWNGNMLFKLQRRIRTNDTVTQALFPPSPPSFQLRSTVQRPTYHLAKANIEETSGTVCLITYAQNYGREALVWPTASETDDNGYATQDVAAINKCNGYTLAGTSALNWSHIRPYPGNVDGGMMVIMRESQYGVTISADAYPGCGMLDWQWDDMNNWPVCCGREQPLASDRSTLSEDERTL